MSLRGPTNSLEHIDLTAIPYIMMEQLHLNLNNNNNNNVNINDLDSTAGTEDLSFSDRHSFMEDRVLTPRPRVSSMENSFIETINSSIPSQDEIVIRQRGRKKAPAKISWSPIKSPFKTPTKRNSTLHMSLLSPSPAKKLFVNANQMTLRSSPRKRIFVDNEATTSCSTPVSTTPTKRLKTIDDRPTNALNLDVPLQTLIKALSHEQLVKLICDVSGKIQTFETKVRESIPSPDIRSYEVQLCEMKKCITRSFPRSRLLSKTDGAAFARANPHLNNFKKTLVKHCKNLIDSHHYDALFDYILIAWSYVQSLPIWEESSHNQIRRDCFKVLTQNTKVALRNGGMSLGRERIENFQNRIKSMANDFEDIGKCRETLDFLGN